MISTLSIVKGSGGRAKMAKFHEKGRFVSFFLIQDEYGHFVFDAKSGNVIKIVVLAKFNRFEWFRKSYVLILRGSGVKNQYKMKKMTKNWKSNKF